jgi:putative radical SAM enzyme (TIGR03279 family)
LTKRPGGLISAVAAGSLGEQIGLQPGDQLVAINQHVLRDVIDVQFYGAEEQLELLVERDGEQWRIELERAYEDQLGLDFVHPTFDVDIRRCANNCDFCFVKQNPRGMRRSLYVKDDDYRYSLLFGNFVTLTNLTAEDWARLEEQRLSPLYVSVHATDLDLRRRFLARQNVPDIMEQLRRLADLGIQVHTQVVLMPGFNDGAFLNQTLRDLQSLRAEPVASVAVVPIGLTKYHSARCRSYTPEESRLVLDQIEPLRVESRALSGRSFVYPSDEWYLVAGRDLPPASEYDDFPQAENGVGMTRQLLDKWQDLRSHLPRARVKAATMVCGRLIAPVLGRILDEWNQLAGTELRLVPVENQFFGAVTTVSGLLTGQDVVDALRGRELGELVLLPRAMFTGRYGAGSAPAGMTLDGMMMEEIGKRVGVRAAMAGSLKEMVAAFE